MSFFEDKTYVGVRVHAKGDTLQFRLSLSVTAGYVLYRCLCYLSINECYYFALFYSPPGSSDDVSFQEDSVVFEGPTKLKDLKSGATSLNDTIELKLEVMCYPMSITRLTDVGAVQLLYYSIRNRVLNEQLECHEIDDIVYLAACSLQIKFGDYDEKKHEKYLIEIARGWVVPPGSIKSKFAQSDRAWLEIIVPWYRDCASWNPMKAQLKYIEKAQSFKRYGVHFFGCLSKSKQSICVGVSPQGVAVYDAKNKNVAKSSYFWLDIWKLKLSKNKFTIKLRSSCKSVGDTVFIFSKYKCAKKVLEYAKLHHHFHLLLSTSVIEKSTDRICQVDLMGLSTKTVSGIGCGDPLRSATDSFFETAGNFEPNEGRRSSWYTFFRERLNLGLQQTTKPSLLVTPLLDEDELSIDDESLTEAGIEEDFDSYYEDPVTIDSAYQLLEERLDDSQRQIPDAAHEMEVQHMEESPCCSSLVEVEVSHSPSQMERPYINAGIRKTKQIQEMNEKAQFVKGSLDEIESARSESSRRLLVKSLSASPYKSDTKPRSPDQGRLVNGLVGRASLKETLLNDCGEDEAPLCGAYALPQLPKERAGSCHQTCERRKSKEMNEDPWVDQSRKRHSKGTFDFEIPPESTLIEISPYKQQQPLTPLWELGSLPENCLKSPTTTI